MPRRHACRRKALRRRYIALALLISAHTAVAAITLSDWKFSLDPDYPGAGGKLTSGPGHENHPGVNLEYDFRCGNSIRCGGAVLAMWTPAQPVSVKRKGAISLWIRSAPEVRLTLVVKDKDQGTRRYPFESLSLEHPTAGWRQAVIPLSAKSTGYGDEDHAGAPKSRLTAIGILAEARYPIAMRGSVSFDDLRLLDSPDQTWTLQSAAPIDPAPPDSARLKPRLGINIHALGDEPLLDAARDAGFSFVRADLQWRQVERNGRYRFGFYDRLVTALDARGMGALLILDYGHPQHGGDPPRKPDDIAAFARFAEAAATHFKGRNVRYEIWNEPNIERFWPPSPRAAEYAALLREAVAAMRRADPNAIVAAGGVARMDLPFLQATLAAGAANQIDAAAVHPYRRAAPETLAAELPLFRQLLAQTAGGKAAIWDTEWGYASYDYFSQNLRGDGHSAAGRKRQAVLADREALTVWALGLPVAVWYDIRDDGDDPRNPEHNYGLLDARNGDKLAMKALRALARIAADRTFAGMVHDVPYGMHAMRLDGASDCTFAVWSDQPDAHLTLRLNPDGFLEATNLIGEPVKPKSRGHGDLEIALPETEGPLYLKFTLPAHAPATLQSLPKSGSAAPRSDTPPIPSPSAPAPAYGTARR